MKVKVGMIGVGGVAQNHLQNVSRMETAELTAVCDLSDAALQAAVTAYGAKGYKDYREMLDKEALDAVYIAIPPFAHGTIEDDVIDKGIHLLVEKPVELNLDEARRKAERIREAGLISASGYCLRYLDALEQAKSFLAGKQVGMALAYRMGRTPETPWFRVMSKSGGQLVEMATHQVDLLRYLIGEITEVYSKMKLRHLDYMDNYDIYDVGTTTFDFACGAIGNIVTGTAFPHLGKQGVEIYGEDFKVSITGPKVSIVDKGVTVGEWTSQNKMFEEEDFRFIEAVRTGDRSLVLADYDEGVKTLAVTLAANLSAESGRPVRIDELSRLTVM